MVRVCSTGHGAGVVGALCLNATAKTDPIDVNQVDVAEMHAALLADKQLLSVYQ